MYEKKYTKQKEFCCKFFVGTQIIKRGALKQKWCKWIYLLKDKKKNKGDAKMSFYFKKSCFDGTISAI